MKSDRNSTTPVWLALDWELIGEVILLLMATGLMVAMVVGSFQWKPGSSLLPRIAGSAGLVFVVLRVIALAQGRLAKSGSVAQAGRIMDIGFTGVEDTKLALRRFAQSAGAILVLVFGILIFGFEIALPTWVFGYMLLFSGQRWYWAVVTGGAFEIVIRLVYDRIFATVWNDPWLFQLFDKFTS